MATAPHWTGTRVEGSKAAAVVKYTPATSKRCSRWTATLNRGRDCIYRASVPFDQGPMAAAEAAAARMLADCQTGNYRPQWKAVSVHSLDETTYCVGFNVQ